MDWIDDMIIHKGTYAEACAKALVYSATIRTRRGLRLSDDLTVVRGMVLLHKLVGRLLQRGAHTEVIDSSDSRKLSKFGQSLFNAGKSCSHAIATSSFPHHRFHPLVELYWKHTRDLYVPPDPSDHWPEDVAAIVRCFEAIRAEAGSKRFRDKRDRHVALVRKDTRSLCNYIKLLFTRYGRLLVIRLDVGYAVGPEGQRPNVSLRTAKKDRERFFNYLRRSCPLDLKGHAWKLEDGAQKGYHYHLLLFFDGYKHWRGIDIAEQLGQEWVAMTGPHASYWNCNADPANAGLGVVDWKDAPKLRALFVDAAPYLTKGAFLITDAEKGVKTFSKGKPPLPPSRPGRPRIR